MEVAQDRRPTPRCRWRRPSHAGGSREGPPRPEASVTRSVDPKGARGRWASGLGTAFLFTFSFSALVSASVCGGRLWPPPRPPPPRTYWLTGSTVTKGRTKAGTAPDPASWTSRSRSCSSSGSGRDVLVVGGQRRRWTALWTSLPCSYRRRVRCPWYTLRRRRLGPLGPTRPRVGSEGLLSLFLQPRPTTRRWDLAGEPGACPTFFLWNFRLIPFTTFFCGPTVETRSVNHVPHLNLVTRRDA